MGFLQKYLSICAFIPVTSAGYFDSAIFVVNLDRATERRQHIEHQFKKVRLDFTRYPAVDGKTLDINHLIDAGILQLWPERLDRMLTLGEVGNYLSHRAIWLEIARQKLEIAVVLEDDVILESDFAAKLEKALSEVPQDWDALYLGCHIDDFWGCNPSRLKSTPDKKFVIMDETGTAGNYAYVLNWRSAEKLYKNSLPMIEPTDHFIQTHMLAKGSNFKSYCTNPEVVKVNYDIGSDIKEMGRP